MPSLFAPLRREAHRLSRLMALLLALGSLLLPPLPALSQRSEETQASAVPAQNDTFGLAHISYGNGQMSSARYWAARNAGVAWNRWVFYWHDVELSAGVFDYTKTDSVVSADRAHGLKTLGVLFGTPNWAVAPPPPTPTPAPTPVAGTQPRVAATELLPPPQVGQKGYPEHVRLQAAQLQSVSNSTLPPPGLDKPVFADGTDQPGPGKTINAENLWARYVFNTAQRYRGLVPAWEIWNEPDFQPTAGTGWFGFWNGSVDQYARILKVAYLSVKHADPNATVVMGGMAYWFRPDFFPRLLAAIKRDPAAPASRYYFDATAWHWYSQPSLIYDQTLWVQDQMARNGITGKKVWITETNLPLCDDPAMKTAVACRPGTHRGNLDHQAAYVIQTAAYAQLAGVERVIFFQLQDDELGPGEFYGFTRNDGTARPALTALRTAATYFQPGGQTYRTPSGGGRVELITTLYPDGQRMRTLWNRLGSQYGVALPVEASAPALVDQAGQVSPLNLASGSLYSFTLPQATLNDNPQSPPAYIVGGRPLLVLETAFSQRPGNLKGRVLSSTGAPVSGARVRAGEQTATTDAQGNYGLDLLPGLYDVAVDLTALPPLADPALSLPVWAGGSHARIFNLKPLYQGFLPLNLFRFRSR